jgi:hypothetical protein
MSNTIQKIKELNKQIDDAFKALETEFKDGLLQLMRENNIKSFDVGVNNHEFNDGDATYFSLYYEDLEIEGIPKEVCEKISKFFGNFDVRDFHERMFGGKYENIEFCVENNKLVIH